MERSICLITAEERNKSLDEALARIKKQYGQGSVMKLDDNPIQQIDVISTGSFALDKAIGIGGIPKGRITEIFGPEGSGKTTVTLHAIANCQAQGGTAVFIDAENAIDLNYAQKLGVDTKKLIVSQPDFGEQALEIAEVLIRSRAVDVVVVDSVAALVPKAELDGEMGQANIGLQARLMSQAMRKLAAVTNKSNTALIFINQLREKVGVMYGNPEVTTGGRALRFYSSLRLDVRRAEAIKQGDKQLGTHVKVKVVKNKMAPPFTIAQFELIYGEGISQESELISIALQKGVIVQNGSWYVYKEEKWQGKESLKTFFTLHPNELIELKEKISG
jgi:recombination protein RecA